MKDDEFVLSASLPNFQKYKKSKNTKILEFTKRLGTALTTRSQQSEILANEPPVSTLHNESYYILLEHVK